MAAQSGMEMMMRSMMRMFGVDPDKVMGTVKQMVDDGTIEKIMKFADDADKIQKTLEEVRNELRYLRAASNPANGTAGVHTLPSPVRSELVAAITGRDDDSVSGRGDGPGEPATSGNASGDADGTCQDAPLAARGG